MKKPLIIPIFIPHRGCPHQCAFCNQNAITHTGENDFDLSLMDETVARYLKYRGNRSSVQLSFYGGTFLGLDPADIIRFMDAASVYAGRGDIQGIRFSTRPDTITRQTMALIRDYPVKTVELGAQSMDDQVLKNARRGHTADDTVAATALLKEAGYEIGLQMMTGLPGDTRETVLATGRALADLKPDFVRIYPAVVLRDSLLARWYQGGRYEPFSLQKSVTLVKELFLMFKDRGIPVIRMGLQAEEELDSGSVVLSGPYHPAFGQLVKSEIFLDRAVELIQENGCSSISTREIGLTVNPRNISNMRGQKNLNIAILKEKFGVDRVCVSGESSLGMEDVVVELL